MNRQLIAGLIVSSATAVVLIVATLFATCSGGAAPTPTSSPSPSPTPTPEISPSPTPPPPETTYRLVYRETGDKEDVIYAAVPSDPAQREEIVRIAHREGFPVLASLSPDARLMAYLALPESARTAESSQAELFIYDLARRETTKVTGGLDYKFRPLWSPDGQLVYMRRYAGFEILSSDVSLLYTRIFRLPHPDDPTPRPTLRPTPTPAPTPTPTLPPDATPTPVPAATPAPEDPIKVMFTGRYSQVASWIPLGFDDDGKSMFFIQVNGGLQASTVVGVVKPATLSAIEESRGQFEVKLMQFLQLFPTPGPDWSPPPPDAPPTPSPLPSPTPDAKLVVRLTDQTADDYSLSPDGNRVLFRASSISGGEFVTKAYMADLIAGTVQEATAGSLPPGEQVSPVWHPANQGFALGVVRQSGESSPVALLPLGSGEVGFMPAPESGFDLPRSYSPDGVWLAVTNFSGSSLIDPGVASFELLAPSGQRWRIAQGSNYASSDAVVGWVMAEALPRPATPAP